MARLSGSVFSMYRNSPSMSAARIAVQNRNNPRDFGHSAESRIIYREPQREKLLPTTPQRAMTAPESRL